MQKAKLHYCITLSVLFLLLLMTNISAAQTEEYKKNSIYLSYGSIINASQYSFSFERLVFQKNHLRTGIKLNYGIVNAEGLDFDTNEKVYDNFKGISGVLLFNIFEINMGLALTEYSLARGINPDPEVDYNEKINGINFYGSAGLRFVNDEFMFKVGIGNLEYLYLGAGLNF